MNAHIMYTDTKHTTHTQRKAKSLAAVKQSRRPDKSLGCLDTTQSLRGSAGKSTWGRASILQVGLFHVQGDGVGTQSPTWATPISGHDQDFEIWVPIDRVEQCE